MVGSGRLASATLVFALVFVARGDATAATPTGPVPTTPRSAAQDASQDDAPAAGNDGTTGEQPTPDAPKSRAADPAFDSWYASRKRELPKAVRKLEKAFDEAAKVQADLGSRSRRRARAAEEGRRALLPLTADLGLAWLAAHQSADGRWSGNGFQDGCGVLSRGECKGNGAPVYDTGLTGLALLAFLRAGHDTTDSEYAHVVRRGLDWLVWSQDESDGSFGREAEFMYSYNHLISLLALSEAALLDDGERWLEAARRALPLTWALQSPGAGWRYGDRQHPEMLKHSSDTSVTAWAIQALVAAREAGLELKDRAFTDAYLYVNAMTDSMTGRTGYYEKGKRPARPPWPEKSWEIWPFDQTESMTAAAMLCRQLLDPDGRIPENVELLAKGAELLLALPPSLGEPGRIDYYAWYYATRALEQQGGAAWRTWRDALIDTLVDHGVEDGDAAGSWNPKLCPWGYTGGRIYSTVLMTLTCLTAREDPDATPEVLDR